MPARTPQDLWRRLVDEAGEDAVERAAGVPVAQAEKELAAAGFDVTAERAKAMEMLERLESEPRASGEVPVATAAPARGRPRSVAVWLAAAAVVAMAAAILYGALKHSPPGEVKPVPSTAPPSSSDGPKTP